MNAMEIDEAAKICELCGGSIVLVLPSAIGVFRPGYWKDSQFQCPDKVAPIGYLHWYILDHMLQPKISIGSKIVDREYSRNLIQPPPPESITG